MLQAGSYWVVKLSPCGHFIAALESEHIVCLIDAYTKEALLKLGCFCKDLILSSEFLFVTDLNFHWNWSMDLLHSGSGLTESLETMGRLKRPLIRSKELLIAKSVSDETEKPQFFVKYGGKRDEPVEAAMPLTN